jgi:putative CocE/NonD family hydrolase
VAGFPIGLMRRAAPAALALIALQSVAWGQSLKYWESSGLSAKATLEREIMVLMRDGVRLSTSVIRPKAPADNLPVILIRTPYDRDGELRREDKLVSALIGAGYALVLQNERGTGWSEGRYQFVGGARNDGYDTLSWIAKQPWSSGKVGTFGCSSSAEHQLGLAAMNHPAHRAMVAMGPGSSIGEVQGVMTHGGFYKGGVPMIDWADWYATHGEIGRPRLPADLSQDERIRFTDRYSPWPGADALAAQKKRLEQSMLELPTQDILKRAGIARTDFDTFITLSPADPRWQRLEFIHDGDHPRVPALYVDAWNDFTSFGTIKLYQYLQNTPNQFLIVAPTKHCRMQQATEHTVVGERDMGDARYDYDGLIVKWFDHWLKDGPNDVLQRPKIQMYMMGTNAWKSYDAWPVPASHALRFYLHSGGRSNTLQGDGRLSTTQPANEAPDAFISDPLHPLPSSGGADSDPAVQDQTAVELRNDVLAYTTEALKEGIAVVGEISAVFYVSSNAPDADLALMVDDVYPDGRAYNVTDTMLRLRYREGFGKSVPMKPGEIYRAEFSGLVTSNFFAPGHRLRIHIGGSNFPLYERNLQTGGRNYDETQPRIASLTIHHSAQHASFLQLPTVTD